MTVVLDNRFDIHLDAVRRVAWDGESVALSAPAQARMQCARDGFMALLDDPDVVIYGVTSGYGQLAKVRLDPAGRKRQAAGAPWAAATSFGGRLPERVARTIVLARLANYVDGYAAISPAIAVAVADMLALPEVPPVPVRGNGGAGEIQPLSHLFAGLGEQFSFAEKDSLCLVNGSPCAAGLVADAILVADRRLTLIEDIFALSAEAIRLPLGHVTPALDLLWGDPHEAAALSALRARLGTGDPARRPYQAPVSYRILPRMLGRLRRALSAARDAATTSLAAVTDNPVYLPPDADHPNGRVVSTGGYHNAMAWPAMDELAACYADLCTLVDRHTAKLLDGNVSGLPDQLIDAGGVRGYLGCVPMAAVGFGEAARKAAQRTFLPGSESGGFGQNDVAPPSFQAWEAQEGAGRMLDAALAGLALIAARAINVTGRAAPDALAARQAVALKAGVEAGINPGIALGNLATAYGAEIYPDPDDGEPAW